ERALGDETVLPEIAETAVRPRALDDLRPAGRHVPRGRRRDGAVLDARHLGDPDPLAVRKRTLAAHRPPTPAKCGGRDEAQLDAALALQGEQRCEDRDAAHVVRRAVDRVDDPAHVAAVVAELL